MKLLGTLGFDWKIFLIQALNFLILFFILKKIFFKSFIRAIQKEKEKSVKLHKAEQTIEEEKMKWQQEKALEMNKVKKKIDKMLEEAESTAHEMRMVSNKEMALQEKKALEKIRRHSQSIAKEYEKEMKKQYRKIIEDKFRTFFEEQLSVTTRRSIQDDLWKSLLSEIKGLEVDEDLLKNEKNKQQTTLSIESVFPLTRKQTKELKDIIKSKMNVKKVVVTKKINPELLAGFSLIVAGLLVEKNLQAIFNH